jgi:hypothetical protein
MNAHIATVQRTKTTKMKRKKLTMVVIQERIIDTSRPDGMIARKVCLCTVFFVTPAAVISRSK